LSPRVPRIKRKKSFMLLGAETKVVHVAIRQPNKGLQPHPALDQKTTDGTFVIAPV
jgi:hypothetical protein